MSSAYYNLIVKLISDSQNVQVTISRYHEYRDQDLEKNEWIVEKRIHKTYRTLHQWSGLPLLSNEPNYP